jgi:transposase InsO family protein
MSGCVFSVLTLDKACPYRVPITRNRSQSYGIAERFVRTLKEWLIEKERHSSEEFAVLSGKFIAEYNARPHQGLPIPRLSPDEFAKRHCRM